MSFALPNHFCPGRVAALQCAVLFATLKKTTWWIDYSSELIHCAQKDYLKRFMTRTTSFTLSCRFCHARIASQDHWKSEIFWELHCKCNSTRSFSLPELRFGITGNQRFPGSCDVIATVRGPFHCAQEDLITIFLTQTTLFATTCRFCHARRRRAAFRQKNKAKDQ